MNFSDGDNFQPPENNNYYPPVNRPRMPHFVPPEIWLKEKATIKKLSTFSAVAILLYILISSVFVGAIQLILMWMQNSPAVDYNLFADKWNSAEFQYGFDILYSVFIVGPPFFLVGHFAKKKGFLKEIPTGKPKNAKHLPIIIIAGFGLCLLGNILTSFIDTYVSVIFGFELQLPEMPETPYNPVGIIFFFISTAVVPALIEELALRGIIMQTLRRYGDMFAVICSALIFGLMHCNLMQIPFAFVSGIVIGYATLVTESIWTGVIIHFLNNAFTVTVTIIDDFYGMESIAYAICNIAFYGLIVIGIILGIVYLKKFSPKNLYRSPLVNIGSGFYGFVPTFSARVSEGSLFQAFLLTPTMIVAFIGVVYQTIVSAIALL
ncbi:MAG: CPBP family intramembrane metalloprotease [Clostridia bacterium]|nr:CPBP family intramembrane metalloprotease [Clostridia bacterium]